MVTKTFIRFFYPGVLFSETSDKEVPRRDPNATREFPKSCYAFRFYDIDEETVEAFGRKETIRDKAKNWSPTYYLGGEILNKAEVKRRGMKIAHTNMECNGWDRVVLTRYGQVFPVEDDEPVIFPYYEKD